MIEPYWTSKDGRHVVYCGDCREVLKSIGAVDVTLTDPPYGVGVQYDKFEDTEENVFNLVENIIPRCIKISKRVALTCATRHQSIYPLPTWILCWLNKAGSYPNPWGFTCWQPVLVYGKDPYLQNCMGSRPDVIDHSESAEKNGHPVPKPIGFWSKLLCRISVLENELILDPFMGSGTTGVACVRLNRRFIGIEISQEYCDIAVERIKRELSQPRLEFEPQPNFEQTSLLQEMESTNG